MKTLIIIPACNEAKNIAGVIADLRRFYPEGDYLVVNDCSTDETAATVRQLGVKYLSLPVNLGIGGCVQAGYRYAQEQHYEYAVQFDGDGQHKAQYIRDLLRPLEDGEADMAVGSRFLADGGFQSTAMRRLGIKFLSRLIHVLCGIRVSDVTSGMRAVNRKMIQFFSAHYAQDYPEPESTLAAARRGARIVEIPVQMRERQYGESSIKPGHATYYIAKVTLALLMSNAEKEGGEI